LLCFHQQVRHEELESSALNDRFVFAGAKEVIGFQFD
jgi:hypothetical protein